jgi:pSer/pThr/pTyr-binding forkhead associated (FHA) protein
MIDDRVVNETEGHELAEGEPISAAEADADAEAAVAILEGEPDEATLAEGTARLIVKRSGAETDEVFTIFPPAIIGRFDPAVGPVDVDLGPLPEGVYVSRKHAKLTFANGVWSIADLNSSNGTYVLQNGDFERVETAELSDGTEFALGNARFVFRLS